MFSLQVAEVDPELLEGGGTHAKSFRSHPLNYHLRQVCTSFVALAKSFYEVKGIRYVRFVDNSTIASYSMVLLCRLLL